MNGFDKLQLWASLAGLLLIFGGIGVVIVWNAWILGIIMLGAGLIAAWIGRIAVAAREQAAQNSLINRSR